MNRDGWIAVLLVLGAAGVAVSYFTECTTQQAKTATGVGVTIADGVCQELEQQPEPEWVLLACILEGVGSALNDAGAFGQTIRVRIPRAQWTAIRTKSADLVFPGK